MKRNLWIPVLVLACIWMAAAVPPAAADDPPHASFYYACGLNCFCGFDAEATSDDGYITNYRWSWGDGTSTNGTDSDPSHTFPATGKYIVTLTVTDNAGQTDSTWRSVQCTK